MPLSTRPKHTSSVIMNKSSESNKNNVSTTTSKDSDEEIEEISTEVTSTPEKSSTDSNASSQDVDHDSEIERQVKKRKLTSKVWDHFERVVEAGGLVKAICNYCRSSLSAMSASGTNHLRRHSEKCFVEHGGITSLAQSQLVFSGCNRMKGAWIFSQEETRKKLAEMIIKHEYPFRIVEHEGFVDLMKTAQPQFSIPSRQTLRNDCVEIFQKLKATEMNKISKAENISLTTNLWTSSDLTSYMVITAHYINDDWQLIKCILSFRPLLSPHTGQVIADRLAQTLVEWKALNKVAFVTLDNASNNDAAIPRLKRFICDRCQVSEHHSTSSYFHMRCLAHVINLVVKEGLKKVSGPVERLRESVKFIHGSSARMESFERAMLACNLDPKMKHPTKDVPTRWNATYLMIESSSPLKLAFQQLSMDDDKFELCPSSLDWDKLAVMKDFLEPFYEATLMLSGTRYPTTNHSYRAMKRIENQFSEASASKLNNSHVTKIIKPMKDKFLKYWEPMQELAAIGLVLDPRYKIRYLQFSLIDMHTSEQIKDFLSKVREAILALSAIYSPVSATSESKAQMPSSPKSKANEDTNRFLQYMNGTTESSQFNAPGAELDLYLEERNIGITSDKDFDLLSWWKINSSRFPTLSKLAKVILMAPATSVASESAFSTGGRVLDDYRSRLSEETTEALLCAQDWIKKK